MIKIDIGTMFLYLLLLIAIIIFCTSFGIAFIYALEMVGGK